MRRRPYRGIATFFLIQAILVAQVYAQSSSRFSKLSSKTSFNTTSEQSVEFTLQMTTRALSGFRTYAALIETLPRKTDRDFLLKTMGAAAEQPVRMRFMEKRTIVFEASDDRSTLYVENPARKQYQLYKRSFVFDPKESAESALKRMRRTLVGAVSAKGRLILPDAAASPLALGGRLVASVLTMRSVYAYLAMWGITSSICVQTNQNSLGQCTLLGLAWPAVAAVMGVGSLAAGIQKVRERNEPAAFQLEDLKCQDPGGTTLTASILDENRDKLDLVFEFSPQGEPVNLLLRPEVSAERKLVFKPDWSLDTDRTSGPGTAIGPAAFSLIAKGTRALFEVCKTTDGRKALEEYFFRTRQEKKVVPKVDDAGISAKSVQ